MWQDCALKCLCHPWRTVAAHALSGAGVAFLLMVLMPAELQAENAVRTATLRRADVPTSASTWRRLIVKYKDDSGVNATEPWLAPVRIPNGKERAMALTATGYRSGRGRHLLRLSHLKSITAHSHVMLSDVALTRVEMKALARQIALDPRVEYAEMDERAYPLMVPNDPDYAARQWNLRAPADDAGGANLPGAWDLSVAGRPLNGTGVTVAVLDTGYRPHPDLMGNLLAGYDFVSMDTDGTFATANDGNGRDTDALDPGDWNSTPREAPEACDAANSTWHGTRVAGIIGAVGNNHTGIIGIAYGAKLLPVRVLGRCGGYVSDIAAGIQWAAGLPIPDTPANPSPAKVINVSIGSAGECASTFQQAITAARNAGSVIVVATGNQGSTTIDAPANCVGVIGVTAHTRLGDNADYANVGLGTHISAPGGGQGSSIGGDGGSVYSTTNTGLTVPEADGYAGDYNGTSFAAPHVSGVVALLLQIRPTLSPDAVRNYLQHNARPYLATTYCEGRSDCGAGMLDAFASVSALQAVQNMPNRAPVMHVPGAQTAVAGSSLQFTVTALDADGDRVFFTASGLPSGASFDGNAGLFSWGRALPGVHFVTIAPTDGVARGNPSTVRITVTGALPSGGGGGATNAIDAIAVLLLVAARWAAGWCARR